MTIQGRLAGIIGAGGEIDLFAALGAFMGFIKLIGKNFLGFITCRAFAGKGFQVLEIFKSGAVLRCSHVGLLFLMFGTSVSVY
jgi:hypothetical protein